MTCCACKSQCPMSKNGLCRPCREIRKQPEIGRVLLNRAAMWAEPRYDQLLLAAGLTQRQAMRKAWKLMRKLLPHFPLAVITTYQLDNPYMTRDARQLLINDALRVAANSRHARRKRIASAGVPAHRKEAA